MSDQQPNALTDSSPEQIAAPHAPRPTSGLIEMQRLFMRARRQQEVVIDPETNVVPDYIISPATDKPPTE